MMNNNDKWGWIGMLLLFLTLNTANGQSKLEEFTKDTTLKIGRLKNGFTYYLKNVKGVETEVRFVVKAGKNEEKANQIQIAHVIEHMAFQKTRNFENSNGFFITQKGLKHFNASTANEATYYYAKVPAGETNTLRELIQFYYECTDDIDMSEENVTKGWASVIAELKLSGYSKDDPPLVKQMLLGNSKFKHQAFLELPSSIESNSRMAVLDYYRKWYRPNHQALIIVGDINVNQVEELIRRQFSDLKPSKFGEINIETTNINLLKWNDTVIVKKPGRLLDKQLSLHIRQPHFFVNNVSDWKRKATIDIINNILFNRFNQKSSNSSRVFYRDDVGFLGPVFDAFVLTHSDPTAVPSSALRDLLIERERLIRYGLSDNEVTKSLKNLLNTKEFSEALNSNDLTIRLSNNFVYKEAIIDPSIHANILRNAVKSITTKEVNRLLKELLKIDNNTAFIVVGENQDRAAGLTIDVFHALIKNIHQEKVEQLKLTYLHTKDAYENLQLFTGDELEELNTKAYKTDFTETRDSISGITTICYPNGITVYFKEIPAYGKADKVLLTSVSHKRKQNESDLEFHLASIASEYIYQKGLFPISRENLDEHNKVKGISYLRPYVNDLNGTLGFVGSFNKSSFENALQLIRRYITVHTPIDTSNFKNFLSKRQINDGSAQRILSEEIRLCEGSYNVTKFLPKRSDLDSLSIQGIEHVYRDKYMSTTSMRYVIVANFNMNDSLRLLFAKYFGTIHAVSAVESLDNITFLARERVCKRPLQLVIPSKNNKNSNVYLTMRGKVDQSFHSELQLEILRTWIDGNVFNRLRNKERGVYSSQVNFDLKESGEFHVNVGFSCDSVDVNRLVNAVKDEIRIASEIIIPDNVFNDMKKALLSSYKANLESDRFWVNYLVSNVYQPERFKLLLNVTDYVGKLLQKGIREVANTININETNVYVLSP